MASTIGLPFVARSVAADFVESGAEHVRVYLGYGFLSKHESPNRVVLVATTDSYGQTTRAGQNPLGVYTRNVGVEAHIWAAAPKQPDPSQQADADQAVLDAVVNQLALSLCRCTSQPGLQLKAGKRRYEADRAGKGAAYVLQFSIQVPILNVKFPDLGINDDVLTWRVAEVDADLTPILDVDPTDDV